MTIPPKRSGKKKISDLHNRLKLINETPDCLFISIHQNSYPYPNNTGTQVFYSPNHPESQALAAAIQQSVIHLIQPQNTRKVKKIRHRDLFALSGENACRYGGVRLHVQRAGNGKAAHRSLSE